MMEIVGAEATALFVGSEEEPRQVVRARVRGTDATADGAPLRVLVRGDGLASDVIALDGLASGASVGASPGAFACVGAASAGSSPAGSSDAGVERFGSRSSFGAPFDRSVIAGEASPWARSDRGRRRSVTKDAGAKLLRRRERPGRTGRRVRPRP